MLKLIYHLGKPFDKLTASCSTSSQQAVRQAHSKLFDKLTASCSTSSQQAGWTAENFLINMAAIGVL